MARTILLADDSATIRKIVELTFSEGDFRVVATGTGEEALARLAEISPDLVLADVVMPEPTGYDVCRAIKGSDRPVPVLLLAGTFEPFDEEMASRCGADGYLIKPFESRALREKVEHLLAPPSTELPPVEPPAGEPVAEQARPEEEVEAAIDELGAEPDAEPSPPGPVDVRPVPTEPPAVEEEPEPVPVVSGVEITPQLVDAVAREVVRRLSDDLLREIAWEVVPDLAAKIIRERIRELESEEPDGS